MVRRNERYNKKSGLRSGFFIAWKEWAFIYEEMPVSKSFSRGCIGGASLNCINFVVPMNIATTKLIQCGIVEMPENEGTEKV